MGDFHIKKIILPSGKSVEIVYFHAEDTLTTSEPEGGTAVDLESCPDCDSGLVYPVSWRETEDDCWEIELRCPNCEWCERGIYRHQDVESFDDVLNRGTDRLIDDLETLTRANMEADIDRFVQALEEDLITPFDF
ncbi:MAG: hypothetical protein JWM86_835 [Thermoleophilia bacterium]|nr:hypothetical protein [Thermoleophilia bacterium]